jgi:hypothetical protein
MMAAAKSEYLEFPPPYLGNFSKGDAQSQTMSFSVRPILLKNSINMGGCFFAESKVF